MNFILKIAQLRSIQASVDILTVVFKEPDVESEEIFKKNLIYTNLKDFLRIQRRQVNGVYKPDCYGFVFQEFPNTFTEMGVLF